MKKIFTFIVALAMTMVGNGVYAQTVVLDEDFSAFTNGSVENPGTVDITGYSSTIEHRLSAILTGWSGRYVFEAGGSLLLKDGGNIQTGSLNISTDGGNARAKFRFKCRDSYGGAVKFSMGYASVSTVEAHDDQWHEASIIFTGSSYTKVKLEPYFSANGVIIDDLKIETSPAFVASPETNYPIDATPTAFTATWKKVTGATGYKVSVFSYNGTERAYFLQDTEATTNSLKVTGLDENKKYFFSVKTVKGEYESEESEEQEVIVVYASIDAPVATLATELTDNGFTANWQAVTIADSYNITLSKEETLTEDQDVAVLTEDFAGVTKGTIASPDLGTMSESSQDQYTSNPGWTASNACYAAGYMGIAPYGSTGFIKMPKLNLSGNEGKFTVTLTGASTSYGSLKEDKIKILIYHAGESEPVETKTISMVANFETYTEEFTTGDAQTIVCVEYTGSNKVLFDAMAVNQSLHAGSKITSVISTDNTTELSKTYNVEMSESITYIYTVTAQVRTLVSGEPGNITSAASNAVSVCGGKTTGIDNVKKATIAAPTKVLRNGQILILRADKTYGIDGIER